MALALMLIAGLFAGLSNLCMRRSIDAGGSSNAFIVIQLFFTFLAALLLNPIRTGCFACDPRVLLLGAACGVMVAGMMWSLGKALERGPPGLSIAALNASTVMPGIIMALIFGAFWGFEYSLIHGVGSLFVALGLFWAGWDANPRGNKLSWALFTLSAFVLHALLLCALQWRALMLEAPRIKSLLVPFQLSSESGQWFMPAMFFVAACVQLMVYSKSERRLPNRFEWIYGLLAGLLTGLCTYLLIRVPEVASASENAMIFPIYAVMVTFVCNCWGRVFYRERVNWVATSVCMAGLFVATVNWPEMLAR